uniref:SFRICE_032299 n=1 Tax=Spodoptera frugiperda TaxID=7108 RepID=A0A2H1X415_SPOFR
MLEEIVYTILPSKRTLRCKKKPYANPANKRREENRNKDDNASEILGELGVSVDNETHTFKTPRFKVPMLMSFLIFYVCVLNVIISCDVSISDVNIKERKGGLYERETVREKPKYWYGHRHDGYEGYGKTLRKGRASTKRQTDDGKPEKYPEAQEFFKYDYIKDKDDVPNATEFPNYFHMGNYVRDDSRAVGYPHDLASHPYFVKNIQFNLRPERHQFMEKIVKLGVLLPADETQVFSLGKVLPIIEMAIPAVTGSDGPLPGWTILVDYRDTRCSSVEGPLAAFEFYVHQAADAFIGPGCEYVIAPVARYAGPWGIPVLTAGAQAEAFGYKDPSYSTLTRMMGSYTQAAVAIRKVFEEFKWRRLSMLYHNYDPASGKGNSPCFMTLSAVVTVLKKNNKGDNIATTIPFDESNITTTKIKELLHKLSKHSRKICCATLL